MVTTAGMDSLGIPLVLLDPWFREDTERKYSPRRHEDELNWHTRFFCLRDLRVFVVRYTFLSVSPRASLEVGTINDTKCAGSRRLMTPTMRTRNSATRILLAIRHPGRERHSYRSRNDRMTLRTCHIQPRTCHIPPGIHFERASRIVSALSPVRTRGADETTIALRATCGLNP